jgi:nucleotidyltransferase substrate binding protein (TIGR01987 family)
VSEQAETLDLTPFQLILERLRESLSIYRNDPSNLLALDSSVKRFELAYEMSVKLIRRVLSDASPNPQEIVNLSFQGLIRMADDRGLVRHGWPEWKRFREARNETVHTYRQEKAIAVLVDAEAFLPEAAFLLESLTRGGEDGATR